ncbi:MAG: flagellar type III secretion system pore protein FliP [Clostridium sp.]|nr:flagellar type III secretion system pore protein FliP [Clostridium sp.]
MKIKRNYKIIAFLSIAIFLAFSKPALAAPEALNIPPVNFSVDGQQSNADYVDNIKIFIFLTILTLLPSFVIMMTSFTRITVVFSLLKNAIGAQQSIPSQVLVGLAIFLTIFIMQPVYSEINETAFKPYANEEITFQTAMDRASLPLKSFMLKETRQKDLQLFIDAANINDEELSRENIPLYAVVPAFAISELKTAFQIGFLLFVPFLIIDMIVGSVLMSMGMMMLPPTVISLAFKILLFVMVDGWNLLIKSLIQSFS